MTEDDDSRESLPLFFLDSTGSGESEGAAGNAENGGDGDDDESLTFEIADDSTDTEAKLDDSTGSSADGETDREPAAAEGAEPVVRRVSGLSNPRKSSFLLGAGAQAPAAAKSLLHRRRSSAGSVEIRRVESCSEEGTASAPPEPHGHHPPQIPRIPSFPGVVRSESEAEAASPETVLPEGGAVAENPADPSHSRAPSSSAEAPKKPESHPPVLQAPFCGVIQ
ncbi:hypothetical protein DIPPA_24167 [Diplonema papillatum]|nr:hypothetical protein DIPPA_24167 [Diplonema papillatum]